MYTRLSKSQQVIVAKAHSLAQSGTSDNTIIYSEERSFIDIFYIMSDFQLLQDRNKSLPYLSRWAREEVTHPSRNFGTTDHWSKMKHKSIDIEVHGTNNQSHKFSGETPSYEKRKRSPLLTHRHEIGGYLRNIGVKSFSDWMIMELNGNTPGSYHKTRQPNPKALRTAANDRARDNFRYWYIEKKPSTLSPKTTLTTSALESVEWKFSFSYILQNPLYLTCLEHSGLNSTPKAFCNISFRFKVDGNETQHIRPSWLVDFKE